MLLRRGSSPERGMGSAACSLRVFGVPAGDKYYRSTCQILYVFGFLISRTDCPTHTSPLAAYQMPLWNLELTVAIRMIVIITLIVIMRMIMDIMTMQ